jgi:hypothetical protein
MSKHNCPQQHVPINSSIAVAAKMLQSKVHTLNFPNKTKAFSRPFTSAKQMVHLLLQQE